MHPGHLLTRYLATYAFYREGFTTAANRLHAYASGREGSVMDEPATAPGTRLIPPPGACTVVPSTTPRRRQLPACRWPPSTLSLRADRFPPMTSLRERPRPLVTSLGPWPRPRWTPLCVVSSGTRAGSRVVEGLHRLGGERRGVSPSTRGAVSLRGRSSRLSARLNAMETLGPSAEHPWWPMTTQSWERACSPRSRRARPSRWGSTASCRRTHVEGVVERDQPDLRVPRAVQKNAVLGCR
jgi:hypothetical protein